MAVKTPEQEFLSKLTSLEAFKDVLSVKTIDSINGKYQNSSKEI
jgi:hypothetical protein